MSYRIVVSIDVEADDLADAYRKVYLAMNQVTGEGTTLEAWESSDESFDNDGDEIDPEVLSEARLEVLDAMAEREGG